MKGSAAFPVRSVRHWVIAALRLYIYQVSSAVP